MPFYRNRVYPHVVSILGNPEPIQDIRRRIVPRAEGKVLEIGVGPGVNFDYYDPAKVEKVFALEPNPRMRNERMRSGAEVRLKLNLSTYPESEFLLPTKASIPLSARSLCA